MKKFLAYLVVAALFAVACAPAMGSEGEAAYPEQLRVFAGLSEHMSKVGAMSNNDNFVYQELEKRTGTHVEWIHPAAGADVDMQINLMVASNDLPDIIVRSTWKSISGGLTMWADDGVILDLTELMPQYMPNYMALLEERPGSLKDITVDGRLYYVAEVTHGSAYRGPVLRGDWLEKLELAAPSTPAQLYDVLVAFKEGDPNGNGEADEWAMSGQAFVTGNFGLGHLLWPWGITYGFMQIDGRVTYGPLEPEFEEAMAFMAKLYAEGLIDPDYSTQDRNSLDGKFMNHQVGYEYGMQPTKMNTAMNGADGFQAIGVPNLMLTEGEPTYVFGNEYTTYITSNSDSVVTGACEQPEKVLAWMDYIFSQEGILLTNYGIEGLSFTFGEDGKPVYDFTGAVAAHPEYDETSAKYMYTLMSLATFPIHQTVEAYFATLHPVSADAIAGWNASADVSRKLPNLSLTAEETEQINDKLVDIDTYIQIQYDKLVTGQVSTDEIPAIQAKLREMGIEECIAMYQQAYDRYMAE